VEGWAAAGFLRVGQGGGGLWDKPLGWPSPEAPPQTPAFARRSAGVGHSSGCRHRQMGIHPGHLHGIEPFERHRQQCGPVWPVKMPRRVMPVSSLRCRAHSGGHPLARLLAEQGLALASCIVGIKLRQCRQALSSSGR